MRDRAGDRLGSEERCQVRPGVVLGNDLGQRPDGEAAGPFVETVGGLVWRCQQGDPVLGQCGGGPELATGGDRIARAVADAAKGREVAGCGQIIDEPDQAIEISAMDQSVPDLVVRLDVVILAVIG